MPSLHDFTLRAQHEAHFGRFKFNRAARAARLRQRLIELMQAFFVQMRVDLSAGEVRMAQHHLKRTQISSPFNEVGRKTVTNLMR